MVDYIIVHYSFSLLEGRLYNPGLLNSGVATDTLWPVRCEWTCHMSLLTRASRASSWFSAPHFPLP